VGSRTASSGSSTRAASFPALDLVHAYRFSDAIPDPQTRIQRGRRILEHEAELSAHRPELLLGHCGDVLAENLDRTGRRLLQRRNAVKVSSGYGSGTVIFAVNCPGSRLWKTRESVWLIRSTVLGVAIALASGKRFLICERL
jgi:hypothetical protein